MVLCSPALCLSPVDGILCHSRWDFGLSALCISGRFLLDRTFPVVTDIRGDVLMYVAALHAGLVHSHVPFSVLCFGVCCSQKSFHFTHRQ